MKRNWLTISVIITALSFITVNAQFSRDFGDEFLASTTGRAFMQAYSALKTNYLNDVNDEIIIQGAINGMLTALDDPYSYYADPETAAKRNEDMSGSFQGIGVLLTTRNRQTGKGVETLTVYQDSPAYEAGLQRGDIFLEIDGTDVRNLTPPEVSDLLRGPENSRVNLLMQRPGQDEPLSFDIKRNEIEIISVQSTVLPNNVGYISLSTFANRKLSEQLAEQLELLASQGIASLILDLRDNGGGFLDQGILVADAFLSEGDIVFQRARGVTQRLAAADSAWFDLPMVVLVNEHSASASEIVTGALQENGRALVVGEETFGKGVAQNVVSLTDGGQLVYMAFEWLTPQRNSINQFGITPDVFAEDTRFPSVISLEGHGATPGQTIEIVVDGEVIGSTMAEEDGQFGFVALGPRPAVSDVQGQALVNLETDNALHVAYDTLLEQVAATATN